MSPLGCGDEPDEYYTLKLKARLFTPPPDGDKLTTRERTLIGLEPRYEPSPRAVPLAAVLHAVEARSAAEEARLTGIRWLIDLCPEVMDVEALE
jgi:hypothetical protein